MRGKIVLERLLILRTAFRASNRIDLQLKVLNAELLKDVICNPDDLCVRARRRSAEHLNAKLVELLKPARLRTFIAKTGHYVTEFDRQRIAEQAIFECGAHRARCPLGAQRKGSAASVLKSEHLFLNHVGGVPHRALEQLGVLKGGDPDFPESVQSCRIQCQVFDKLPFVALGGQCILGSPRRFG